MATGFWLVMVTVLLVPAVAARAGTFSDSVEVQVVDLQVSVIDEHGNYINNLTPDDFVVVEDDQPQQVLDLELNRQPFSIGVLMDTSSSMQSIFQMTLRSTRDFLSSLRKQDEYFLMTFDERIIIRKDFDQPDAAAEAELKGLRFGNGTRFFDAMLSALEHLRTAHEPRRALFLISDGVNTSGGGNLAEVIEQAQRAKVLVYALIIEKSDTDIRSVYELVQSTGGSYFVLFDGFPRLQAAYDKIAADLSNRFTLYYHSSTPADPKHRPVIQVGVKNPHWKVRYQKAYYFPE